LRLLQSVSDPVILAAEIRATRADLSKRADRRGLGTRNPEPPTVLDQFTARLRIACAQASSARSTVTVATAEADPQALVQSSPTGAVVLSEMTTATAFGSLWR
jgi:hypothetical protein